MYSRDNVVSRVILRANTNTAERQDLLIDCIQSAEDFVSLHTYLTVSEFPTQLESIILQMSLEIFNQFKSEGFQNETVEGVTIRYQETFEKYRVPLRRYKKLRTI